MNFTPSRRVMSTYLYPGPNLYPLASHISLAPALGCIVSRLSEPYSWLKNGQSPPGSDCGSKFSKLPVSPMRRIPPRFLSGARVDAAATTGSSSPERAGRAETERPRAAARPTNCRRVNLRASVWSPVGECDIGFLLICFGWPRLTCPTYVTYVTYVTYQLIYGAFKYVTRDTVPSIATGMSCGT